MALTDINFQEGEGQDFIIEIALLAPGLISDIATDGGQSELISEIAGAGGGNNIFIMSE